MTQRDAPKTGLQDIVGWGAFLACSWTWCIGMYLPVLLIRDFGPLSFAVFAVPNVLGAVLMGMLLDRPGASEELVRRHGKACWAFSFITLAFQVFFLCWLILGLDLGVSRWVLAPMLLVILFIGRGDRASAWTRFVSILVLALSLGAGAWWLRHFPPVGGIQPPRLDAKELAWMAPVCALGFGLCPYLDLTFHTARQRAAGRAGTFAFALGFGVFFLAMIMLTLLYTGPLLARAQGSGRDLQPGLLALPMVLHVSVQLVFTVMLHKSWIEADPSPAGPAAPVNASLLALVLGVVVAIVSYKMGDYAGLTGTELVYRGFMGFYGLVFPAYVWTCVVCGRREGGPGVRQMVALAAALVVAGPMYWMGFIESKTWWLGPGVLVVLVAGLLAREPRRAVH
jgi:MFS family permease